MMLFETLIYSIKNGICTIALNRPQKRNAFDAKFVDELKQAFLVAQADFDVRVIVLKAVGDVFSAGADLAYLQELQQNTYEENLADSKSLSALYQLIYTLQKPVIAQVEGHAIAGGCGLVTVCDFVFAVPLAQFGYSEVKIGFIPAIVMIYLLRKINERNATELLLTGNLIDAEYAKQIGLINKVVDAQLIDEVVLQFAQQLIDKTSRNSLHQTKQMIASIQEMALADAIDFAVEMNAKTRNTPDCKQGIAAFLQKKTPKWL